jgi:uncharacterized BrkB/YihY/UPF0761 family membrane protein
VPLTLLGLVLLSTFGLEGVWRDAIAPACSVRYGPAEHPEARWASAGSLAVIGSWILATVGFKWWVSSVANFETATGTLTAFLVLTAYVFVSAAIFLLGAQLDELLRKDARGN